LNKQLKPKCTRTQLKRQIRDTETHRTQKNNRIRNGKITGVDVVQIKEVGSIDIYILWPPICCLFTIGNRTSLSIDIIIDIFDIKTCFIAQQR
jgi:hypothetical protein